LSKQKNPLTRYKADQGIPFFIHWYRMQSLYHGDASHSISTGRSSGSRIILLTIAFPCR